MRMAATERLALAVAVSAGAHFAVLAQVPLAPGLREVALFPAQALNARISPAPAPALPQVSEPLPASQEPVAAPAQPAAPAPVAQAAGLPTAEIYFRGSEVDERALPLNEVNLVYPEQALVERRGGVVTLRLKIDHLGALRDVAVVEAHPAGVFENAAIEAVSALKFQAARRNGVPVGSLKTIEIPFDPDCMRNSTCVAGPQDKAAAR